MTPSSRGRTPLYFYYRGDLHKRVHINRPKDVMIAWHYKANKPETYSYLDVRRHGKRAWTTTEVCKLLKRSRRAVANALISGYFKLPEKTYTLDEHRNPFKYMWTEDNIMDLHEYFCTKHIGRPRNDGEITAGKGLPTARELRAMLRGNNVHYIQTDDNKYVPTFDKDNI